MHKLICEAIKSKRIIKFNYDGFERVVEPHTCGIHKATGNVVLSAYQVGGYSSSEKIPYWRLYVVDKITDLEITNEIFIEPRPGYRRGDSRMSIIYCEI
ncbi:MAG: hypothetical protein QW051_03405 [Candidatus Aenigmatarchaeota archaeon]